MSSTMTGRVVLVTGAARGLGRSHAVALAAPGARVVVNDTGAGLDGRGSDAGAAAAVVEEITRAGGEAVVSTHDVSTHDGARAAVRTALDTWGRLDALVNNAGILRDKTYAKMPMEDFDAVLAVHLGAAAYCTSAAWPALRDSGTGRVVLTSSASGLYGQFGQANYAAGKMALIGLLNTLKHEGERSGILVNAIAPVATTRMTQPLLPAEVHDGLAPERVSPLVVHLASAACAHTGLVLEVGAGMVARVQVVESEPMDLPATDDGVADVVRALADIAAGRPYATSGEALARILDRARSATG